MIKSHGPACPSKNGGVCLLEARDTDTPLQAAARDALWHLENMTTEEFQHGADSGARAALRKALA